MLVDVTVLVELVAAYLFALLAGVSSDAAGIAAAFAATSECWGTDIALHLCT
jgi:hypothetical protein